MAEKKKKKEKTEITLPNISRSIKRSNDMAQGKANYQDAWKAVGIIIAVLVVLFVLLGGINQRAFLDTMINFATNIGDKFTSWVDKGDIEVNSDGIYIRPAGSDGGLITGNNESANASTAVNDSNVTNESDSTSSDSSSSETSSTTSEETSNLSAF